MDSFGTTDIPISTPIPTATTLWRKSAIGQPKAVKAASKPTTSTTTKSGRLAPTLLPIAKHPCPHWHVATAKMDRNIIQKRNNGNGTFSWKYYKDNVTVQHRK